MNERIIYRGNPKSQQRDPARERDLISVAAVGLLVPQAALEYGLQYQAGRPFFVLA